MDEVVPKPANLQVIKCILDEMILYKENWLYWLFETNLQSL